MPGTSQAQALGQLAGFDRADLREQEGEFLATIAANQVGLAQGLDRKSTRLNSSH